MPSTRRTPPSLKSASGAGFTFEDRVAAFFMVEMLCGRPSLRSGHWGVPWRIRRQVTRFHPFEDVVLDYHDANGEEFSCAVSVKSGLPSVRSGFTKGIVADMWNVIDSDSTRDVDHLCVACQPLRANAKYLERLLTRSLHCSAELFEAELRGDGEEQCHETFRHPKDPDRLPAKLMRRLVLRHDFDFESGQSAEADVIRLCRTLLTRDDERQSVSSGLWDAILTISCALRVHGGSRTLPEMLSELRTRFPLLEAPDDRDAWQSVRSISGGAMSQIVSSLPSGEKAVRSGELTEIKLGLGEQKTLAIVGESGAGKSTLAKMHVEALDPTTTEVIWLSQPDFSRVKFTASELSGLIQRGRRQKGVLVLDGAENWQRPADFAFVRTLVQCIEGTSGWNAMITCQHYDWPRVSKNLAAPGCASPSTFRCGHLSDLDIDLLSATSPSISLLAAQPRLRDLVRKPQMLNVMLQCVLEDENAVHTWISEVDVANGWWQQQVCGGQEHLAGGTLIRKLACMMADKLVIELVEQESDGYESEVDGLRKRGVLQGDPQKRGRLRFVHDLYADWSRLRHLRGLHVDALRQFADSHIESPPWFRSLSLLFQQLLESASEHEHWRNLVLPLLQEVKTHDDHHHGREVSTPHIQVVDAALAALIRCSAPAEALEAVSDALLSEGSALLRRLLRSMQLTATVPDPLVAAYAKESLNLSDDELQNLKRFARLPNLSLWEPVIEFLCAHSQEVLPSIALAVADLMPMFQSAMTILKQVARPLPAWWKEWCELAVACGEQELKWEIQDVWRPSNTLGRTGRDPRVRIYKAALLAADQCADRVAKLALKAAGRMEWEKGDLPSRHDIAWGGEITPARRKPRVEEVHVPPSWKDGPKRKISEDFQMACLQGNELAPLMESRPEVVIELVLAFSIKWPKGDQRSDRYSAIDDPNQLSIDSHDWHPPFFTQGPFLALLRINPTPALNLIIRLVDFATEDHLRKRYGEEGVEPLPMNSSAGITYWKGDSRVLAWHYYDGHNFITSALMALEKWLLDELSQKRSIAAPIQHIFSKGSSAALAGVLIMVGKAHPELFLTELKPLVFVASLFECDAVGNLRQFKANPELAFSPHAILSAPIRDWHSQSHRCTSLENISYEWIRTRPEFRPLFEEVAQSFREQAKRRKDKEMRSLLRLAWNLDFSNWIETPYPDGPSGWHTQQPAEILETLDPALSRQFEIDDVLTRCLQVVRSRPVMDEAHAGGWWDAFETVRGWRDSSDQRQIDDALAGLMCVMVCVAFDWISRHPEKLDLIEATAKQMMMEVGAGSGDFADRGETKSELFMAIIVARFWASRRDPANWRKAAARFAMAFRYRVVETLFAEAWQLRNQLEPGFDTLFNLVLGYAEQRGHQGMFPETISKNGDHLRQWRDTWEERFQKGDTPVFPKAWGCMIGTHPELPQNQPKSEAGNTWLQPYHEKNPRRIEYAFDVGLVLAARDCIPAADLARRSPESSTYSKQTDENLFVALLRTLPDYVAHDPDKEPEAYRNDHVILRRIAIRTLIDGGDISTPPFWRPLLSKGPNAANFASHFVTELKSQHLRLQTDVSALMQLWREMLDFLGGSDLWKPLEEPNDSTVWDEMLFIREFMPENPAPAFAPLILALKPYYRQTLTAMKPWGFRFQRYLQFFASADAAKSLLPDVITWLGPLIAGEGRINCRDTSISSALSRIASIAWKHHLEAIRSSRECQASFVSIVNALVAVQDGAAIEVHDALGSSIGV